jgi:hypothetical protein
MLLLSVFRLIKKKSQVAVLTKQSKFGKFKLPNKFNHFMDIIVMFGHFLILIQENKFLAVVMITL